MINKFKKLHLKESLKVSLKKGGER